jgi:hypothetical protein
MNTTPAPITTRPNAAASRVLPQRKVTPPPAVPRPFQVLQGGRAPAQLSLLLRPVLTLR